MNLLIVLTALVIAQGYEAKIKECEDLLKAVSSKNALYIQCVGNHAVPVQICIECDKDYTAMQEAYKDFLKGTGNNGTNCTSEYVNVDRLNLIVNTEAVLTNIWNSAFCRECYNSDGKPANDTIKFEHLILKYEICNSTHKSNGFCKNCTGVYNDLNNYFNNIKQEHKNNICFDILDKMNRTRSTWTKICGHDNPQYSLVAFGAVSTVLSSIPLLFYCAFFIYTQRSDRHQPVLIEDAVSSRNAFAEDPGYNHLRNEADGSNTVNESGRRRETLHTSSS